MYTKQEAAKLREAFWTAFGHYMRPVLSADGEKTNWVNYKTGLPGIRFRMDADVQRATITIELAHTDADVRMAYYQQFELLKSVLHDTLAEAWLWQPDTADEYGKPTSRISATLPGVNIYRNEDWPQIISFFKPRIMALDEFWSMAKYNFYGLG